MTEGLAVAIVTALSAVTVAGLGLLGELLRRQVKAVKADTRQLQTNGGSTLADSVNRVERLVELVHRGAVDDRAALDDVNRRVTDHQRRNEQTVARLTEAVQALTHRIDLVEVVVAREDPNRAA